MGGTTILFMTIGRFFLQAAALRGWQAVVEVAFTRRCLHLLGLGFRLIPAQMSTLYMSPDPACKPFIAEDGGTCLSDQRKLER